MPLALARADMGEQTATSRRIIVPARAVEVLPVPTPSPTPAPTLDPTTTGPGLFDQAPGSSSVSGPGVVHTFSVEVERGLGIEPVAFASRVEGALFDERSWGARGRIAFRRVPSGGSFRVTLASAGTTRRLCQPLDTGRSLSCFKRGRAVLNAYRWFHGSPYYQSLEDYRTYLVNHEVGHALRQGHVGCPSPGAVAPVMLQQTKGLQGCRANPWPYPEGGTEPG